MTLNETRQNLVYRQVGTSASALFFFFFFFFFKKNQCLFSVVANHMVENIYSVCYPVCVMCQCSYRLLLPCFATISKSQNRNSISILVLAIDFFRSILPSVSQMSISRRLQHRPKVLNPGVLVDRTRSLLYRSDALQIQD